MGVFVDPGSVLSDSFFLVASDSLYSIASDSLSPSFCLSVSAIFAVVDLSLFSVALGPPPRIRIGGVVSVVRNTVAGSLAHALVGIALSVVLLSSCMYTGIESRGGFSDTVCPACRCL